MEKKRTNPRKRVATAKNIEDVKHKATGNGIEGALIVMFSVLHDKHGWGKVRLQRLKQQVAFQFECIREAYVSFADLRKMLQDECKVELVC